MPLLIAVAVAALVADFFLAPKPSGPAPKPNLPAALAALVLVGVLFLASRLAPADRSADLSTTGIGALLGLLAGSLASFRPTPGFALGSGALAFAIGAVLPGQANVPLSSGLLLGLSLAGGMAGSGTGALLALAGFGGASVSILAARAVESPQVPLGAALLAAAALGVSLASRLGSNLAKAALSGVVAAAAGEWLSRSGFPSGLAGLAAAGAVAGWLVAAMGEDEESAPGRRELALLLLVALAGVSFSLGRGLGVAVAGVSCLAAGAFLREKWSPLLLLPLGFALVRAYREIDPAGLRFLDFGQNALVLGLALGMLLPLVGASYAQSGRREVSTLLCAPLVALLAIGAIVSLGAPAATGILLGVSVAALPLAADALTAVPLAGVAGFVALRGPSLLGTALEASRDEKMRNLAILAVAVVLIGALPFLIRKQPVSEASHA